MQFITTHSTTKEWEMLIGDQVRSTRVAHDLDQAELARKANVSVGAISNLERGRGSTLGTLVAVARALDRTEWLQALAPAVTISPIRMLRGTKASPPRRVRSRKTAPHIAKTP
ncbi:MAG: helix-turn-helix transcriptional regulator [Acidimicrobiales bacterium]